MALSGANERERKQLKAIGLVGILIVTVGLACLNVTGAWIISGSWQYTLTVTGAEICAAVFLGLAVIAQTMVRKLAGFLLFGVIMLICVENGKFAVRELFDGIFVGSHEELTERARLIEAGIPALEAGQSVDAEDRRETLSLKRREIATLEAERAIMASPARIREAQTILQSLGLYTLPIDGVDGPETRQARLARADAINRDVAILQGEVRQLEAVSQPASTRVDVGDIGSAAVVLTPAQQAQASVVELRAQAESVVYYERWMHGLLYGLELVRSAALWAFIMTSTAAGTGRRTSIEEEAAETITPDDVRAKVILDEAGGQSASEAVAPPEMTQQQLNGQKGALARKAYADARLAKKLPIGPASVFDEPAYAEAAE